MSGFLETLALRAAGLSAAGGPQLLAPRPQARFEPVPGGIEPGGIENAAAAEPFERITEIAAPPGPAPAPAAPELTAPAPPGATTPGTAPAPVEAATPRASPDPGRREQPRSIVCLGGW